VSPADSKILSFTEVTGNDVLLVKNIKYNLAEFITGEKRAEEGKLMQDML
jgi:phosphatidylserine decarboxylase